LLGPLLGGLGLALVVAEDPIATERLKRRSDWAPRAECNVTARRRSLDDLIQDRAMALLERRGVELERAAAPYSG